MESGKGHVLTHQEGRLEVAFKKVKAVMSSLWKSITIHGCRLPYGITQY